MNGLVSVTFVVIMIMTITIMPFIAFPSAVSLIKRSRCTRYAPEHVVANWRMLNCGAALSLDTPHPFATLSQRLSHYETQQR